MGVKIDNIDLKEYFSFTVIDIQGREIPALKEYTTIDDKDIQYHMYSKYQPRKLTLKGYIYDSNVKIIGGGYALKTAKTLLNEFNNLISASLNQPKEIYFDDTQRTIIGRITEKPLSVERKSPYFSSQVYQVELNIVCDDILGTSTLWDGDGAIFQPQKIISEAPINLINNCSFSSTTIVNILGVDGNFEDANTLQNGWIATNTTNSKTTGVFGTKSQKCVATSTDGQHYIYRSLTDYGIANHKYFFCAYVKTANGKCRFYTQYRNSAGDFIGSASASNYFQNTNFIKMYGTQEIISMYSTPVFNFFFAIIKADNTVSFPGTNEEIYVDGAMVVDLTNMGNLPAPLRKFFNNFSYTTWASLAVTSNITAGGRTQTGEAWLSELLPFVDSVATVGWNYSSGAVTTTVENRGENLFKIQEFKDYINTYDSAALYFKDEGYDVVDFRHFLFQGKPFMKGKFKPSTQYKFKATSKIAATGHNLILYFIYTDGTTSALTYTNTFYDRKTLTTTAGKTLDYLYITYASGSRSRVSLGDFMIYEGTQDKPYVPSRNEQLSFNTALFNHLDKEDTLYYDAGLKKLKRWHYQTIVKSTTFAATTYSGTGTCLLVSSTGAIYYTTITGTDIVEGSIPDGTYTVIYQLTSPVIENVNYSGELNLITGENHFLTSQLLIMQIEGKKKHLII